MRRFSRKMLTCALVAIVGLWTWGWVRTPQSDAADACSRKSFQTKLVEEACKKGGQAEAKKVMKVFLKKIQEKKDGFTCLDCHKAVEGAYELKPDALKLFKEYGGQ